MMILPISYFVKMQKYNRKHPTKAEELLWEHLRGKQLGVRFRRQHPVYDYIPDFVCLSLNLIIEVDGDYHLAEEQQLSDRERDTYLQHFWLSYHKIL